MTFEEWRLAAGVALIVAFLWAANGFPLPW